VNRPGTSSVGALRRLRDRAEELWHGERAVRVGMDRIYVDSLDRFVAAWRWKVGRAQKELRSLVTRVVRPGMVAVDVGANVGLLTFELARRVGALGRVYAVEPEREAFRMLSRSVGEAALSQVELRQVAASDRGGWMTLYVSLRDRGDHRIVPAEEERAVTTVRAVCLDDLLADETRVDFVAIEVQGAELSVLRGLKRTLAANPAIGVACVLCPALLRRAGVDVLALFEPLCNAGLQAHRIAADASLQPLDAAAAARHAEGAGRLPLFFRRPAPQEAKARN
jgi:FkbM family methyltransferase